MYHRRQCWFVLTCHVASAYLDPARKTSHAPSHCAVSSSSHDSYPASTVLPPHWANTFDAAGWVKRYVTALTVWPVDFGTLRVLQIASENASGTADSFGLPKHFEQNWFDFIQAKFKMLDALEVRAGLHALWQPQRSLVDIGGGHGMLAAYLMARHGTNVTVFDIANSYQCEEIVSSVLRVNFFDGQVLPLKSNAADAVSFMSVLHHAGNSTRRLLHEAARIARSWIIVLEDTQTSAMAKRNKKHDPRGIFRTDAEWKQEFKRVPGFCLARDGYVGRPLRRGNFVYGVRGDEPRCFSKWYVLEKCFAQPATQAALANPVDLLGSAAHGPLASSKRVVCRDAVQTET